MSVRSWRTTRTPDTAGGTWPLRVTCPLPRRWRRTSASPTWFPRTLSTMVAPGTRSSGTPPALSVPSASPAATAIGHWERACSVASGAVHCVRWPPPGSYAPACLTRQTRGASERGQYNRCPTSLCHSTSARSQTRPPLDLRRRTELRHSGSLAYFLRPVLLMTFSPGVFADLAVQRPGLSRLPYRELES